MDQGKRGEKDHYSARKDSKFGGILNIFRFCISLYLLPFFACGYYFLEKKSFFPINIDTPFFINQTFEPGIEGFFTAALYEEFLPHGDGSKEGPSINIEGVVKSFQNSSLSYDREGKVLEYRASVKLSITIEKEGRLIFKDDSLFLFEEYNASSDPAITVANKIEAIKKMAKRVAERIYHILYLKLRTTDDG